MRRLALVALAISCPHTNASQAEPTALSLETRLSSDFDKCISASGGVTTVMRDCAAQEYVRIDRKLNTAWRATMSRMPDDEARFRLRQLQREWIKTRWVECDEQVARSGMAGGAGGLLIHDTCKLGVIARRISWLEAYHP